MTDPQRSSWLKEHGVTITIAVAGWLIAAMASYAAMSSRVTAVEVTNAQQERRIERIESTIDALDRVVGKLDVLVGKLDRQQDQTP